MPFSTSDALTDEAVRQRLEEVVQENLGFREAFRNTDVPDDAGSTWNIPQPDDTIGEPAVLQPGEDYPGTEEDYTKVAINRNKYGFKMAFLDEAVMDNTSFDVIADQVDRAGRQFAEKLNVEAYNELTNNVNTDSPANSNQNGVMTRDDYLVGLGLLESEGYDPDVMIMDHNALEDLRTDSDFTRSTELSDQILTSGELPMVDGMNIVLDSTGNLTSNDAYIVDTDFYGYEAIWEGITTEAWRDENTDQEYRKARSYRSWKAMDSAAAIKINS